MSVDSTAGDLVRIGKVAETLGVSTSWVRRLADEDELPSVRTAGGHRMFDLAAVMSEWERRTVLLPPSTVERVEVFRENLALAGLEEHLVWQRVAGVIGLDQGSAAYGSLHYVLTEMVNNAIDHSRGTHVTVAARVDDDWVDVSVEDNGIGIYRKMRAHLDLPDETAAILELTKGKRTTDPDHHTGEGIFFSSRAAAVFSVAANGLEWVVDNRRGDQAVGSSDILAGTTVEFSIPKHGGRAIEAVFAEFVDDDSCFARTRPSVRLAEIGTLFVSRSEAKRLMQGLEKFDEVELDFAGVTRVGQGFADEVFRVWQSAHPETRLVPVRMSEPVDFMIRRSADLTPRY